MPAASSVKPNIPELHPSAITLRIIEREILGLRELLEYRIDGMDKAQATLTDNIYRLPTVLDREISKLSELTNERFSGIEKQFHERDVRAEANKTAANTAVNAALTAQREAVASQNLANAQAIAKAEAATVKQIDGILALFSSNNRSLDDKIAAINKRLDSGEGRSGGQTDQIGRLLAVGSFIIAVVLGGLSLIRATH